MNKRLFLPLVVSMALAFSTVSHASEVYFGTLMGSTARSAPSSTKHAKYVGGILLDKTFFDRVTPKVKVETLMDSTNSSGSFHPASVRYDIGVDLRIYDGLHLDVTRMCWHPVDGSGNVEEYWSATLKYKW